MTQGTACILFEMLYQGMEAAVLADFILCDLIIVSSKTKRDQLNRAFSFFRRVPIHAYHGFVIYNHRSFYV